MNIEPRKYNRRALRWVIGTVVGVFFLVWACSPHAATPVPRGSGGVANLPVPTTAPYSAPYLAPQPTPAAAADTGVGDGVYEVGADLPAGKYKTPGADAGQLYVNCYYARLRHNDGSVGDILQNNNTKGQATITLKVGEFFQTTGCQGWAKVG
jgi:hypothetical protein